MFREGNLSRSVYSLPMDPFAIEHSEQPFTFESQSISSARHKHNEHNDKDDDTDHSQYKSYLEKDYKMRMESLVKSYELKMSREQETYDLKEMKYVEEINNLKRQLKELSNPVVKENKVQVSDHCSICSNGEVIEHMKNMLEAVEKEHKGCLPEKTILSSKISGLEQKLAVFEIENEEIEDKLRVSKQEMKQIKVDKENWEREKREKDKQIRELERVHQIKEMSFEQEITKYKICQKELENEIKKMDINNNELINQLKDKSKFEKSKECEYTGINEYEEFVMPQHNYENRYQRKSNQVARQEDQSLRRKYQEEPVLRPTSRTNMTDLESISIHQKVSKRKEVADYFQEKRNKNFETKSTTLSQQETFETFRPSSKSYLGHKELQGRNTAMAKYNYFG